VSEHKLSLTESDRFMTLEIAFAKVCERWIEGAAILLEIRDSRLYRQSYRTFEDYCRERWNLSRRRAYQLIGAGEVIENVNHGSQILPENERQVRPLTDLEPAQQREVWRQAVSTAPAGKITAAHVKTVKGQVLAKESASAEKNASKPTITLSGIVDKKLVEVAYPERQGKHQFNPTNDAVDWASWTWNPVTGCLHGCKYCYAREMAYRFTDTYPIQFAPLFHHDRLDAPINTKPGTGRAQDCRVFVCSMADLFGEWVPQNWIDAVLDATLKAPEWEYLFLTKFPQRYRRINLPPKAWFGASVDIQKRVKITEKAMPELDVAVRWISVEPMLEPLVFSDLSWCDLLVIGAQSETNQPDGFVPAFAPRMEWIIDLIAQARAADVPVYLKPNLLGELTGSKPGMALPQEHPRRRRS
jgi:protein gp37